MKKKLLPIILILVGFLIVFSPILFNILNSNKQKNIINKYRQNISNDKSLQNKIEIAKEYNNSIEKDQHISVSLEEEKSNTKTNFESGELIGYITIDKINVNLPIYEGTSKDVLQKGVGHVESSSIPIGGDGTHAVLAGHTGLANNEIFDKIDQLKIGDKFSINVLGIELEYIVDNIRIVEPDDTQSIRIEKDKDLVTLVTCTPPKLNTYRLLVTGKRENYKIINQNKVLEIDENNTLENNIPEDMLENDEKIENTNSKNSNIFKNFLYIVLIFAIIILVLLVSYYSKKNNN